MSEFTVDNAYLVFSNYVWRSYISMSFEALLTCDSSYYFIISSSFWMEFVLY